jgi:DNA repair ATPase RecN
MKKCVVVLLLIIGLPCFLKAQTEEAEQLLLDVQKLSQLKQMLADLKKGYEIVYKGYSTIKNISEGNFNLHQVFLDGLLEVSPAVRNYKKVADIISLQLRIVSEYKSAFKQFKENGKFTPDGIDYMGKVYSNLFDESIKNIETLTMIITSGTLRMSDDERLKQIDDLYEDMVDKLTFLRHFNNQTSVLALQRTREEKQINFSKKIYGLSN